MLFTPNVTRTTRPCCARQQRLTTSTCNAASRPAQPRCIAGDCVQMLEALSFSIAFSQLAAIRRALPYTLPCSTTTHAPDRRYTMIPPLLSQNSRRLLSRFFAREGRLAAAPTTSAPAAGQAASTSQSTTPTLAWEHNPFSSSLVKNSRGHTKYRSAKYSPRRQKQLYRAMEIVKLQQELFKPTSVQVSDSAGESQQGTFALPEHWVLPPSDKSKSMSSFSTAASSSSLSPSSSTSSSSEAQSTYTAKDATKRGPYKGRKNGAFKLHKWERNHQAKLDDRKEKLASMPARIAEYTKVCPSVAFSPSRNKTVYLFNRSRMRSFWPGPNADKPISPYL